MSEKQTTTCRFHCGACRRHFSSLSAFDGHRRGSHQKGRYCIDPGDDEERFEVLSMDAACRMYTETQAPVTVWTTRGSRERMQRVYGEAA